MNILRGLIVSCRTGEVLREASEDECLRSFKSSVQRSASNGSCYWGNCVGVIKDQDGEDVFVRRVDPIREVWVPTPRPLCNTSAKEQQ